MAQPITWRNVAAPDATAAIKGMAYANETLNSAFAKAQGTVDTMVGRVAQGHADAKDTNTRSIMQAIDGITSMDKYKEAIASGDFNPDVLTQRFGKDIDLDAVYTRIKGLDNEIMAQETQDYNYKRLGEDRAAEEHIAKFKKDVLATPITKDNFASYTERLNALPIADRYKPELVEFTDRQRTGDKAENLADIQHGWKATERANAQKEYEYQQKLRKDDALLTGNIMKARERNLAVPQARTSFTEDFVGEAISANPVMGHLFTGVDKDGYPISADISKIPIDVLKGLSSQNMENPSPEMRKILGAAAIRGNPAGDQLAIGKQLAKELQQTFLTRYGEQLDSRPDLNDDTLSEINGLALQGIANPTSDQLAAADRLSTTLHTALTAATSEMSAQEKARYDVDLGGIKKETEKSIMDVNQKFDSQIKELETRQAMIMQSGGHQPAEPAFEALKPRLQEMADWFNRDDSGPTQKRGQTAVNELEDLIRAGFTYTDMDGKKKTIPYNAYAVNTAFTVDNKSDTIGYDDESVNPIKYKSLLDQRMQDWVDSQQGGRLTQQLEKERADALWKVNSGLSAAINKLTRERTKR